MSWLVNPVDSGNVHVQPIDDLRPHEDSLACWCRPRRHPETGYVVVHNSLDKRELNERR